MATLTIRQIEAPAPGKLPRTLALSGWAGPINEIEWGGSQRASVEPISQSGTPSVRLDGPEEDATVFSFMWRSRLMQPGDATLDGAEIATADELVAVVDSMRRDTALVEVTWRARTCVGFIEKASAKEAREGEYHGEISVKWVQSPGFLGAWQGPTVQGAASFTESLAASFETAMADIEAGVTFAANAVDDAQQAVANVRGAIGRMRRAISTAGNAAQDAIGIKRAVGASIEEFAGLTGAGLDVLSIPYAEIAQVDDPVVQIQARAWRNDQARALRVLRHRSALERGRYAADGDLLGIHYAVQGETVWLVSWIWYRTTELADFIGRVNGLRSTTLAGGQRLIIPRRPGAPDRPSYLPRVS